MDNIAKVNYNGVDYSVTVNVQPATTVDQGSTTTVDQAQDPIDYQAQVSKQKVEGGRKPRRTSRRGPGRPLKTRRNRLRSIRR